MDVVASSADVPDGDVGVWSHFLDLLSRLAVHPRPHAVEEAEGDVWVQLGADTLKQGSSRPGKGHLQMEVGILPTEGGKEGEGRESVLFLCGMQVLLGVFFAYLGFCALAWYT